MKYDDKPDNDTNGDSPGDDNQYHNDDDEVIELASDDEIMQMEEGDEIDMDGEGDGEPLDEAEHIDDSIFTFEAHKEPVFCIKLHPVNHSLVATGHKDSVTQVSFSADGTYLATGDMSGLIQVWNIATKETVWSFEVADLEWMQWHRGGSLLLASDADGIVWMWKIPSGSCSTFDFSGVAATICHFLPLNTMLAAGYGNGVVKIWNLTSPSQQMPTFSGNNGHQGSITCLDSYSSNPSDNNATLISGSTDGMMNVYNLEKGKLVKSFDCHGSGEEGANSSVESVAHCSNRVIAAAATTSGDLFIFNLTAMTCALKLNTNQMPITKVIWHQKSPMLYASDTDGVITLWNGLTGENIAKFYGHSAEIHDLSVTEQGVVFATASEDGTAKLYEVTENSLPKTFDISELLNK
ncbi:AAMP [Bugula neritina]|uniref:AAMP n=1 Tax=Bugula neritina TaxID=10212 RepID=A0A7J7ISX2_BUGNE|nr:AAMP [Bugula neritina]